MTKKLLFLLALVAGQSLAQNTLSHGTSVLFRGTSNLGTYATHAECVNAARVRTITAQTAYECRENLSVTPTQAAPPASTITGLDFAGNTGSWDDIRFRFTGAALLPMQPATYIWNLMPRQQSGYFTTFFHAPQSFPNSNSFYGAHPYPVNGVHKWEIAANFGDYTNDANGNNTTVQWGRWHTQALVVASAGGGNTTFTFYWDLPNTNKKIVTTTQTPTPVAGQALSFGLAPWAIPSERLNGILRGIRLYSASLSPADILAESDAPLSTSAGTAAVWYMNMNPTPSDISDKSGRGHHPAWAGSGRPALWSQ